MISSVFLKRGAVLAATAGALAVAASWPALAQVAEPEPNKGDTAWMIVATVLVLMMSVPGLALFYGGLVRTKNMLSVLAQVLAVVCLAAIIWVVYGYSLAFTNGGSLNMFVGGLSKMFLAGVTPDSNAATFSNGVVIPEYIYLAFQMTFACITPALIVGAFAERIKFSAVLLFTALWLTVVYFPIAHMVWYWAGPDEVAAAARAVAEAADDAARAAATVRLNAVNADAGLLFQWDALDFAGGTVVHINAGLAGLIGCIMIGKRVGYPREAMAPHSLVMTMVGASLLWIGWFGFNAGSALEANGETALAIVNTLVATAAGTLAWMTMEWLARGKPSLLGMVSGVISGLVAVTPAAGFAGPMGAIVLGLLSGVVCYYFVTEIKHRFGYDDTADVFGIHCIAGILGALATGILVNPALGGVGTVDYAANPGAATAAAYAFGPQMLAQIKAVLFTIVWCGIGSFVIFKVVDMLVGLRVELDEERQGLDVATHGERAYNY